MVYGTLSTVTVTPSGSRAPKYRFAIVSLITMARRHGLEIARLDVAAANQARTDGMEKVRADAIE